MEFSRQEYWCGLLFPSPGDLPNPGIEPTSPTLQADSLPSEPPGKPAFVEDSGNIFFKIFFSYMDNFWNLYWICHNIVSVLCFCFFWPWGMWALTSLTTDWTCAPRIGRWSFNLWDVREVPGLKIDWKGGMMEFLAADRLFLFKFMFVFIYLAVLGLSFVLWGLVLWPGIKPGLPASGAQSPSHWTTREVPWLCSLSPGRHTCFSNSFHHIHKRWEFHCM